MTASDRLTLTGLRVRAHHGVFDFERADGQEFVIDAVVELDSRAAASGDDLAATVHYGELATELADAARRDPVDLIETLAERLARVVLSHAAATTAIITVHKPQAPISELFDDVAITIVRSRSSGDAG